MNTLFTYLYKCILYLRENNGTFIHEVILLLLFIYSHVHTFFGSFLPPVPLRHPLLPCSALISNFVEEKT
jgi:hypothetical protein